MTIKEMIEKRARAWEAAKVFLDEHTKDGKMSAEDAAVYDKMESEVVDYGKTIERMERQAKTDAEFAKPASDPITNQPGAESKTGRASEDYKRDMIAALRSNFRTVTNILQEGVATDGGYLVPEEWDNRLIDTLDEENIMRRLSTVITTNGLHKINIAGTKPAAVWVDEAQPLTFDDAKFSQISLDAHKLHVAVKVTNELLADAAFNLEAYIIQQFGRAIANAEEDAFLNGSATVTAGTPGRPVGLFTTGTVGVTAASSTAITADEIISLVYALKRPYRRRAAFIMNDAIIAAIRKLKDANNAYMWQPSYQQNEPDRLLGYPLYTSAYAPKIAADTAVIAFGDISYYNIGDRGTRAIQELRELFAGNDMTGYIMKERVDGRLVLPEAVQLLKMKA